MLSPNTARKRTCSEDAGSAFASKRPAFVDDNHDDRIGPTTSSTSTSVGTQWSIEDYQLKSRVPIDFIESFTAHLYRSHSALFRRWRMASLLTARLGLEMATSLSARGYINDRTRVVSLLRRCPQITTLNLGMLQETTADEQRRFVAALGVHGPFPQVTSLVLPHYLSALEWNALVTACPNVTTVDLEHTIGTTQTRVMKGLVDELVRFGHLRHLRLPVQCNTVVALPALTTLESLGNVQALAPRGVEVTLRRLRAALRWVQFNTVVVGPLASRALVDVLDEMPRLETLVFRQVMQTTSILEYMHMAACTRTLVALDISNARCTANQCHYLKAFTALRVLLVNHCNLSRVDLVHIGELSTPLMTLGLAGLKTSISYGVLKRCFQPHRATLRVVDCSFSSNNYWPRVLERLPAIEVVQVVQNTYTLERLMRAVAPPPTLCKLVVDTSSVADTRLRLPSIIAVHGSQMCLSLKQPLDTNDVDDVQCRL